MFPGRVAGSIIPGSSPPKIFRPDKIETVERGLPTLLTEMEIAQINTPVRCAAFLTHLAFESLFEYDIKQFNSTSRYAGRGYIQLTGLLNYTEAGKWLGVDLVGVAPDDAPELARDIRYSAKIARWYWTVARRINPMADALNFGATCKAMGYPVGDGSNDLKRCAVFKTALKYLSGSVPGGIDCVR